MDDEMKNSDSGINRCKLVVMGVPYDATTAQLQEHFAPFGELSDAFIMSDWHTGRSRGFGFIVFKRQEDADRCLQERHSMGGRELEVRVASPKKESVSTEAPRCTRIFVGKIPTSVSEAEVKEYFEKYGSMTDAYLPKDFATKRHRGIAFLTFSQPEAVEALMKESHTLGGQALAVDKATPKDSGPISGVGRGAAFSGPVRPGWGVNPMMAGGRGGYTGGMGRGMVGAVSPGMGPAALGMEMGMGGRAAALAGMGMGVGMASSPSVESCKLFVGKLGFDVTEDDLTDHFATFGRVMDVYIPKDASKKSHRGFAFITFDRPSAAYRAARQPSHMIKGKPVPVDLATPRGEEAPAYGAGAGLGMAAAGVGAVANGGMLGRGVAGLGMESLAGGYGMGGVPMASGGMGMSLPGSLGGGGAFSLSGGVQGSFGDAGLPNALGAGFFGGGPVLHSSSHRNDRLHKPY
eukprot:jgi/Mesvir1/21888/Mv01957-RA.1